MDKLSKYQDIVIAFIKEHAKRKPVNMPDIDSYTVIDQERNHFQLLQSGWQDDRFVFTRVSAAVAIELKNRDFFLD
jgi:hypothetical protein